MEYHYRLTSKERFILANYFVWKQFINGRKILHLIALLMLCFLLQQYWMTSPIFLIFTVILIIGGYWGILIFNQYRKISGEDTFFQIADGRVCFSGKRYYESSVTRLQGRISFRLFWLLEYQWLGKQKLYYVLPKRIFRDKEEEMFFFQELDAQKVQEKEKENKLKEEADGYFEYPVGPQRLAHLLAVSQATLKWIKKPLVKLLQPAGASESQILTWIETKNYGRDLLGHRFLYFNREKIYCFVNQTEFCFLWSKLKKLVLTEDVYVLCYEDVTTLAMWPRDIFQNSSMTEQDFLCYCEDRGIEILQNPGKVRTKGRAGWIPVLIAALIFAVIMGKTFFDPGMHPGHASLRQQKEVLEELGFSISEEAMEYYESLMEDNPALQAYIEDNPYEYLLIYLTAPEYEYDEVAGMWQLGAFSEDGYWFDWEAVDVVQDYVNILQGLEYMSSGELVFTEIQWDDSEVSWEKGSGRLTYTFKCNGNPCEIQVQVTNDWLDTRILVKLNEMIQEQKLDNRIYACEDGGQGAILFYRDKEWAKKFTRLTGIHLEAP